jgi:hypothetical protein
VKKKNAHGAFKLLLFRPSTFRPSTFRPRSVFLFLFPSMRFPATILLCVVAAYALSFYLAIPANPEIQFWHHVVDVRADEIAQVRADQPSTPIIFFTGGSSTAFSIDPKIIEETCGLPAFNLGLPVAAGAQYILHQAFEQTRKNDILVICLEPDLLTTTNEEHGCSKFSFALSTAAGQPSDAAGGSTFASYPTIRNYLNFTRPGPSHLATSAAKTVTGKNGYRYTLADIRYRGRAETPMRDPSMKRAGAKTTSHLTDIGRKLLQTVADAAALRGVHLFYSMPWHFTDETHLAANRIHNLQILEDIRSIMPTIDDGFTGAASDPTWFSDSPQHLTAEGSTTRTQALAIPLKQWLLTTNNN